MISPCKWIFAFPFACVPDLHRVFLEAKKIPPQLSRDRLVSDKRKVDVKNFRSPNDVEVNS